MPRQEPRGRHQLVRPPQLLLNPIVQKIRSAIAMRFTRLLACLCMQEFVCTRQAKISTATIEGDGFVLAKAQSSSLFLTAEQPFS